MSAVTVLVFVLIQPDLDNPPLLSAPPSRPKCQICFVALLTSGRVGVRRGAGDLPTSVESRVI